MNPRSAALLLVVAAALGAFVYFYEIRGGEQRRDAAAESKRLFPGVEANAVEWIALETKDGRSARIERKEGAWELVEPISFPGDAVNLDGMAAGLADLASEQVIETPQAPEVYGIDDASRRVRFGAGGRDYELRIGKTAPVGSSTYVVTAEQPERIVTVPTYRVTNLERSLDDLRDRRVVVFDRSTIGAIDARWPGGGVRLSREGGAWQMTEPVTGPADDTAVDTLLSNLSYLRADSFEDEPRPDASTGLDAPDFEVTLTGETDPGGGTPSSFQLAFGREEGGQRLVRSGQSSLYRIAATRIDDLPRTLGAYRFKELSRYVSTDAATVHLSFETPGENAFEETYQLDDDGWKASPEPVEAGRIARLVAELARLRGSDVFAEDVEAGQLAKLGLAPPRVAVRVLGAASGDLAPAELGAVDIGLDPDGQGPVARKPGSGTVMRLDPTVQEWLPTSLEHFRDRFVQQPGDAPSEPAPAADDAENEPAPESAED